MTYEYVKKFIGVDAIPELDNHRGPLSIKLSNTNCLKQENIMVTKVISELKIFSKLSRNWPQRIYSYSKIQCTGKLLLERHETEKPETYIRQFAKQIQLVLKEHDLLFRVSDVVLLLKKKQQFLCFTMYFLLIQESPSNRDITSVKHFFLIREVSFGGREHYMHSQYLLPRICVLCRGVPYPESVL